MENENSENLSGATYAFYQPEDVQYAGLSYTSHLPYQAVPSSQGPEMLGMRQLSIMPHQSYPYPTSPTRVAAGMQLPPSPSPVDSASYEHPISPPVSGSDVSTDSQTHYGHSHSYSRESSSGAGSPPARGSSLVHRTQHRYNPTAPSSRSKRRRNTTQEDGDNSDGDEPDAVGLSPQSTGGATGQIMAETLANTRKEATRRQRIEAEQRRRDDLREGYARLKDVLPLSNQKSSKVSLLERATNYIANLDQSNKILHSRLASLEAEVARLREINERLSITVAHHTGHMPTEADLGLSPPPPQHFEDPNVEQRPLSPPPDVHPPTHVHVGQIVHQQHENLYHHRTESSASGSQASGSEY